MSKIKTIFASLVALGWAIPITLAHSGAAAFSNGTTSALGNTSDYSNGTLDTEDFAGPIACIAPAIEEFPEPLLNMKQRRSGGLVIHVSVAVLMILLVSILCKEHFVPALHCLIDSLQVDPDVAGGTLMAAASSVPTLVTSVIGINVVHNDLGLSTTLGSGVLNAAGVLSISALLAKRSVELHRWPLFRSSVFFLISVLVCLFCLMDQKIEKEEAAVMVGLYGIYVVVMACNKPLETLFSKCFCCQDSDDINEEDASYPDKSLVLTYHRSYGDPSAGLSVIGTKDDMPNDLQSDPNPSDKKSKPQFENLSTPRRMYFMISFPFSFLFSLVIPNCKSERWRKYYLLTFFMSGALIAGFSYVLVWMMCIVGFTLGIPDSVLGLTFLSISVTLPDVMASVLVVRKGFGDMAVCYVLGTNVFELLVGLGVPWLLETLVLHPGTTVPLQSHGLVYSMAGLLITVFLVPALTFATRWKMSKTYGAILLIWYSAFLVFSVLYQLNIFGDSNPPSCYSDY